MDLASNPAEAVALRVLATFVGRPGIIGALRNGEVLSAIRKDGLHS